jgi:aminoglycoside phosphotransferase (APT) family kinase protein
LVRELNERNAAAYIADRLHLNLRAIQATSLGGGVSNHVVLIETPEQRFVLKQSLPKLRVEEDWFSDRERVFREADALRRLSPLLPPGSVPQVLFEDRENFAFAMAAAPEGAVNWKAQLLAEDLAPAIAETIARIHGSVMMISWESPEWESVFGDLTAFEQLRLNAYYEFTAARHPDLKPYFDAALKRCRTERRCLVHGDWSPKNMMIHGSSVMVIDFEVIHFGDPAFDTAFLLNHLLLKCFHKPDCRAGYLALAEHYWNVLNAIMTPANEWLESATLQHLPLLLLARMDGKSPAEYITDPILKAEIREFARDMILHPPTYVTDVFRRIA